MNEIRSAFIQTLPCIWCMTHISQGRNIFWGSPRPVLRSKDKFVCGCVTMVMLPSAIDLFVQSSRTYTQSLRLLSVRHRTCCPISCYLMAMQNVQVCLHIRQRTDAIGNGDSPTKAYLPVLVNIC